MLLFYIVAKMSMFLDIFQRCQVSGSVAKKTLLLVHTGFTLMIHGVIISMDVAIMRDYGQTYTALQVT